MYLQIVQARRISPCELTIQTTWLVEPYFCHCAARARNSCHHRPSSEAARTPKCLPGPYDAHFRRLPSALQLVSDSSSLVSGFFADLLLAPSPIRSKLSIISSHKIQTLTMQRRNVLHILQPGATNILIRSFILLVQQLLRGVLEESPQL